MKSCFTVLIVLVILLAGGGFVAYSWYTNATTAAVSDSSDTVEFKVSEGDNLTTIAKDLETKGLIKSELALRVYTRLNDIPANIKVGTYFIPKNLTLAQVIEQLEKGVLKKAVSVTLREALRPEQAADTVATAVSSLGSDIKFSANEYIAISENPWNYSFSTIAQSFLDLNKPSDKPLIGFLFPDTYSVDADTTALDLVNTQIENLVNRLEEKGVDVNHTTPETPTFYEGLILASIIEKESGATDDRQLISSVFHNRLADGIPLQSDATINFFTLRDDPRSTLAETQIDNPYNTYMYAGLTPTPINSPGVLSIYAAQYPKESGYYYFRHDSAANIYFSETFEEHQESIYLHP